LDLGHVKVKSAIEQKPGRWFNNHNKTVYVSTIHLENKKARLDFIDAKTGEILNCIFKEDQIDFSIETVNASPLILEPWEEEQRILKNMPALLDLSQLDLSTKILIRTDVLKLVFNPRTWVALFNLLNNNVMYTDRYEAHFARHLHSQAD